MYNEKIKVESVSQAIGDLALRFGEGVSGEDAKMVYQCDDCSRVLSGLLCSLEVSMRTDLNCTVLNLR